VPGASFAVGIAYTSVWFSKERQGTALGIFGAGNAGAAITLMGAPSLLGWLTNGGAKPEAWTALPLIYGAAALLMAIVFWATTQNRLPEASVKKTLVERLAPLKQVQVWRFGLYYFLVFGAFVGLSGWLLKYYVDVFQLSLASAGVLAAVFSLPSGVIRAFGGWMSDRLGARAVMYWILGTCLAGCLLLCLPLDIVSFTVVVCAVGIAMGIGKAAVYKHIPTYFPKQVGVVGGMVGVIGGLGGFVCPLLFGALLTATTTPATPTGEWRTAWVFLAAVSTVALVWMHYAVKRIELRKSQQQPAEAVGGLRSVPLTVS
jgi:NNP family nitrate/nitrite transporter-like MFS transporter